MNALARELQRLVGHDAVLHRPEDLLLYEYDASVEKGRPEAVVFPTTTEQVSRIVKLAAHSNTPIVGRGAGTGLSGGALPRAGGVMIAFARMNRILEIDLENQRATVQAGLVNADLTRAVEADGFYFAPDPSSQKSSTIGGNVSENAGGPHTLAYGVTTNHVTALGLVLPDGEIVHVGTKQGDASPFDLAALFVGSEGTLALVSEITVKLSRKPEAITTLLAIFDAIDDASETVAEITARGITPSACEMMDGWTLRAVEEYIHAGFPTDSAAILLIEVEGLNETVALQTAAIDEVCRGHHAREVRVAQDAQQRELLWKGRKNSFGALGRIAPGNYVLDGVIPRSKLPQTLRHIQQLGEKYGCFIGNIFHAGDGNLHPIVLFDPRDTAQFQRAMEVSAEIIRYCVQVGGSLTGEHGIGMEKSELMPLLFSDADFALMRRVHDALNPTCSLNPGKIFPLGKGCGETRIRSHPATTVATA
ncbi:MAG TPA: FAD-linked oxidase C-terminal domain-containing protein [Candidatus Eisenbacteria bacterium]|jgi:glycolate oxidase|nr:FAD-linked oxidase C-terminal domain-containing protein [Candidatus Eisenbacteria bacterium]